MTSVDKAVAALMKSIHDATGHFTGVEINQFICEINHLVSVATLEGRQSMQGNLDQIVTRERCETEEKTREQIRSTKVKETSYTNQNGVICLAYVIPAASLDVTVTEAHKKLMQWALIGAIATGKKQP